MLSRFHSQSKKLKNLYTSGRTYVQRGLSLTPSEMMISAEHGVPISSNLADPSLFHDGDTTNSMHIDPLLMRGVDVVDAWNIQKRSKKNLLAAQQRDVETYGL